MSPLGADRTQPLEVAAFVSPAGDIGLREVLNDHPEWVAAISLPAAIPDVDTMGDLRALRGDD